ncbi:PulJ/GspJ family protein [Pleurocapsa sp. FMAR1]|uniref:PulJ/GspJ family protein n=1 Tax=Pleurocapsa sp. FMAR1 TaxID=3040204 RepID=UPI0029C60987|nr:type II secretion system protein [Pleurocapsa sp. FMAR1]
MKNKELYKLLKKNKFNANSGFTLIELLIGLFMSIFVIGALGFGLVTVLGTTQSENSKAKARNENSRALDFISDELRRARKIETNATNAPRFTVSGATVVLALDIPLINDSVTLDTDSDPNIKDERVIYYLKSNSGTNWKGPQVLYRWGPPLNANGEYSPKPAGTINSWTEQALIDGINNTTVTSPCTTGTVTPTNPTGFYACITGTNTAQLFLTGQTKTASGVNNDSQTNDTQVVARARETLAYKTDENTSVVWSVEGLGGNYKCKDSAEPWWHMRTDFSNSATPVSWTQNPNSTTQAQPQPIEIKSDQPLTITSNPINATGCNSSSLAVAHTVNFGNPTTFNGECDRDPALTGSCPSVADKPRVKGDSNETVQFFKKGSSVPNYGGSELGQQTLGRFLYDKGWAIIDRDNNTTTGTQTEILNNRNTKFKIPTSVTEIDAYKVYVDSLTSLTAEQKTAEKARLKLLGEDQRIIGFEIGVHASTTEPGFDLQDNIFVVTSDVFEKKFAPSCFSGTACSAATGRPTST